jgi:hypothetical protein
MPETHARRFRWAIPEGPAEYRLVGTKQSVEAIALPRLPKSEYRVPGSSPDLTAIPSTNSTEKGALYSNLIPPSGVTVGIRLPHIPEHTLSSKLSLYGRWSHPFGLRCARVGKE